MSSTPRLPSGYPVTPGTTTRRRGRNQQETPSSIGSDWSGAGSLASKSGSLAGKSPTLPRAPENQPAPRLAEPVVPLTFLDAPQQRFYAFGIYAVLQAWKLYDWLAVLEDGEGSWWLFLKWTLIDFAFVFGLPELRIPWLELSPTSAATVFGLHLFWNMGSMLHLWIPWQGLLGFVKVLYDRELSISEHNVKVSNILNNHSLIMGRQIINILPEGTAVLNPDQLPFCVRPKTKIAAELPIYFNATIPAEMELIRIDLDTNKEETIKVPSRDVKRVAKQIKEHNDADPENSGFAWRYPVKKPGVYRLGRVLDEYKLEVQRSVKDTYVVPCPQAKFQTSESSERCIRDLSDLSLEIIGTPPLKIVYNRTINGLNHRVHFQSVQPDGFSSPLLSGSSALVSDNDNDVSWVRPSKVVVGFNESLTLAGEWAYSVDEVHDAFGNVFKYADHGEDSDKALPRGLTQKFLVRERPKARMSACDLRRPLKVAKGKAEFLPIQIAGSPDSDRLTHQIGYEFSPINSLTNSGDHGKESVVETYTSLQALDKPAVSEPGLYTIRSVSSGSCEGEVVEPSSCLLLNPLEPQVSIRSEEIPDKCAGNTIGLRLDLDLVGTPPFALRYDVISGNNKVTNQIHRVNGLRSQLELIPQTAGRHRYVFKSISDEVYTGLPLTGSDKVLEQVVKPAASASLANTGGLITGCLDSEVEIDVRLLGDAPFSLEWEIVHEGRRKTERVRDVQSNTFKIKTAPLTKGGDYVLALSSVQDQRGCRTFLQEQVKISIRRQRPRGGFVSNKQSNSVMAVADTPQRLPLRLQGEGPWTIHYRNLNSTSSEMQKTATEANDYLVVKSRGIYEITQVEDAACPGSVDPASSTFSVDWFPRPELSLIMSESIESKGDAFVKQDVCEGDIDGFEVNFKGAPPYHVQYEVKHKPVSGSAAISRKSFDAALSKAAITMDTSKAGTYSYKFFGLADDIYHADREFSPIMVQQRVNAKPSASFSKPGQAFKYCVEEQEHEDNIPITLTGVAPFYVEVEVKHQSGAAAETYRISSINSKTYNMQIPRQHLHLGIQQVRIRTVRDARGCQQKYETGGPSIHVNLYDAPSIYPLESRQDYCVGERIAYTLSGTPPFDIAYDFNGRWNAKSQTTSFRRIAEKPGEFVITSISDKASECRAAVRLPKTIHPLPSVRISQGKNSRVDIHEGNEVDIHFEFWGTPPFEFTYTRSTNARKGQRSEILETRHDISYENNKVIKATQEGTYEVVAIKDKFCSYSTLQLEKKDAA